MINALNLYTVVDEDCCQVVIKRLYSHQSPNGEVKV